MEDKVCILCEECCARNTTRYHENRGGESVNLPEWPTAEDLLEKMV